MKKFAEVLHNGFQATYDVLEVLYHNKTEHQELIIFDNPIFGRIMALDGIIQTTERDEFIYHEMFAHTPILSHPDPKKVLIIGGGDGGLLREVTKHTSIEKITMVEIDRAVVELSEKYLPKHSDGAFADPRLNLVIADGLDFIISNKEQYDIILSDSTDPIGPGAALFAEKFYQGCAASLNPEGILVTQNGVSFLQTSELVQTKNRMQPHFQQVKFLQADVPTYVAGNMNLAWANKGQFQQKSIAEVANYLDFANIKLRYFTPELYKSAFNLPNYLLLALEEKNNEYANI